MAGPKQNQQESSQRRRSESRIWLFALIAVSIFSRFFELGIKPPHFDEGINGHFVTTIWRDGYYSYDPTNFHGPLYFYFCQLAEVLFGRSVESFRILTAGLSVTLVLLIYRFRRFVGTSAFVAAWILALSPAFSFYGRYAIHETLFILGQVLFVYGRFEWMNRPTRASVAWMATGIVILVTTKETFFIFLGTWLIAELCVYLLERFERASGVPQGFATLVAKERRDIFFDLAMVGGIAVLVTAALYSGFFEYARGLGDFFRAFDFWSKTGTKGNGHEKPFLYWIELLWRYEWPLLVGLGLSTLTTICLRFENRKLRILLLAGFGSWLAYSLIPYKTPWLLLGFWPLAFFFVPMSGTARSGDGYLKYLFPALVALLIGVSSVQMWRLNFRNFADPHEPYVYVQTTKDYTVVMDILKKKLERSPEARNIPIVVLIQDPWPLPFDLSLYPKMRYARIDDLDKDPSILAGAGLLLIDGTILDGLRRVFPKRFGRLKFQLRDAYGLGWALFDYDLFQTVLPKSVEVEEAAR